jgi:hypothetical protein
LNSRVWASVLKLRVCCCLFPVRVLFLSIPTLPTPWALSSCQHLLQVRLEGCRKSFQRESIVALSAGREGDETYATTRPNLHSIPDNVVLYDQNVLVRWIDTTIFAAQQVFTAVGSVCKHGQGLMIFVSLVASFQVTVRGCSTPSQHPAT